jgi:hypothetical protein
MFDRPTLVDDALGRCELCHKPYEAAVAAILGVSPRFCSARCAELAADGAQAADVLDKAKSLTVSVDATVDLQDLDTDALWENAYFARQKARELQNDAAAMEAEAMRRMLEDQATRLALPGLGDGAFVELVREKVTDRRIDVLRALYDCADRNLLPLEEVQAAIWEFFPESTWKTDLRALRKLSKYGGEPARIITAGVVDDLGPWKPKLVLNP